MDEEMTDVLNPSDDEKEEDECALFTQQVRKDYFRGGKRASPVPSWVRNQKQIGAKF